MKGPIHPALAGGDVWDPWFPPKRGIPTTVYHPLGNSTRTNGRVITKNNTDTGNDHDRPVL